MKTPKTSNSNKVTLTQKTLLIGVAAIVVLASVGIAGAYFANNSSGSDDAVTKTTTTTTVKTSNGDMPWKGKPGSAVGQQVQQLPKCNDNNILGMATGAVLGGVLGNQVGGGSGKTVATIGGAAGGAYLGQQAIPLNNATCRN